MDATGGIVHSNDGVSRFLRGGGGVFQSRFRPICRLPVGAAEGKRMAFCTKCGQSVKDTANFCGYCGQPLRHALTSLPTTPAAEQTTPPATVVAPVNSWVPASTKLDAPQPAPVSHVYWSQPPAPPATEAPASKPEEPALKLPEPFNLPADLPLLTPVGFPLALSVNTEPPLQEPLKEVAAIKSPPPTRKETELAGMVGAYSVIGGYTAALIGLFGPVVMLVLFAFFGTADFAEGVFYFFVFVLLGAFVWVPISVILAVILGIGGLALGLTTGLLAAILFRLTHRYAELYQFTRVVVAIANAAAFGYAAYWLYTHSFFMEFFEELTAGPAIIAIIGALAGFVMALVDPEKSDQPTEMTAEESEEAKMVLVAPFALWGKVAGRLGRASAETVGEAVDNGLRSQYDPNHPGFQKKEMERMNREVEQQMQQMKRGEEAFQREMKRIEAETHKYVPIPPLKPPHKKR